nr:TPA_asm: hypothetical protein HUJ06_002813 [Nelumbo nucifera]
MKREASLGVDESGDASGVVSQSRFDGCTRDVRKDDDGRPCRTGTVWTATAHIITAVIGSGVLSLAWAVAQLGWIAGPATLIVFSLITLYTSYLLADCYRSPDPVLGKRNYTYMESVRSNLGGTMHLICGIVQYVYLVGTAIGYTITGSISIAAIYKSNCFHKRGHDAPCLISTDPFLITFGIVQIILSQIPNFHKLSWLSTLAAVMSFGYAAIGIALSMVKVISGKIGKSSLTGVEIGVDVSEAQKVWRIFKALGDIAFAYVYSVILLEIQDTLRSTPAENKVMKKATMISVSITTVFYMLCGCMGYAAFGNDAPGNMLTGFGFYEPYWLIDLANMFIVVHLVGAFQVFGQPFFAAVEAWAGRRWPNSKLITGEYQVSRKYMRYSMNMFRLIWRSLFVIVVTVVAMLMPFFNEIVGLLGAIGYWPLSVYFPVEMYISQKKIARFTSLWVALQLLNLGCLLITLAAICGSIQGIIEDLRVYKPFNSKQ